jgi:hypothetical protein
VPACAHVCVFCLSYLRPHDAMKACEGASVHVLTKSCCVLIPASVRCIVVLCNAAHRHMLLCCSHSLAVPCCVLQPAGCCCRHSNAERRYVVFCGSCNVLLHAVAPACAHTAGLNATHVIKMWCIFAINTRAHAWCVHFLPQLQYHCNTGFDAIVAPSLS